MNSPGRTIEQVTEMEKTVRIIALCMILVSVLVLIITQWTPILAHIPVGAAMALWGGDHFSTMPTRRKERESRDLYE